MFFTLALVLFVIQSSNGISSPLTPFTSYNHSVDLQTNVSSLWWTVDETNQMILFELHTQTTGWIALGISPAGGMPGADIGVGWVDRSGDVYFQDRYAYDYIKPVLDNTTTDWFALQGREEDGWTAIQFTRALDTCDTMDVAIESGTNHLIFAYGLVDVDLCSSTSDITYHETRRGEKTLSLRSYSDPPLESKFAQFDYFEFRLNNYTVPSADTTYHCKVYKVPVNYPTKQHVIAHKILVDSINRDLVHHLLMYECDSTASFDDSNLPDDLCDNIHLQLNLCLTNIATGWAIGGDDIVEFPPEAGYPVGGNFSIKYYLIQMHYDNSLLRENRTDSSGIRFYVTNVTRQYDIGYLTFGTDTTAFSLAIPPQVENFVIDSYCPMNASSYFPSTGITLLTAFPHTHLQGKSVFTKLIRNKTAVQYLYNAESYDFNYQFENRLPKRIQIYPGDEFVTRCVYNTMNKNTSTLGGESTREEMCLHMFTYFPRMDNISVCLSRNNPVAWRSFMNNNFTNETALEILITNVTWTSQLAVNWQNFYSNASRIAYYGRSINLKIIILPKIPAYEDLKEVNCTRLQNPNNSTNISIQCGLAGRQKISIFILLFSFFIKIIIDI